MFQPAWYFSKTSRNSSSRGFKNRAIPLIAFFFLFSWPKVSFQAAAARIRENLLSFFERQEMLPEWVCRHAVCCCLLYSCALCPWENSSESFPNNSFLCCCQAADTCFQKKALYGDCICAQVWFLGDYQMRSELKREHVPAYCDCRRHADALNESEKTLTIILLQFEGLCQLER